MEDSEIISEVRFITNYPDVVIPDSRIQKAIDFTKNEMRSIFGNEELEFDSFEAGRATMWGTCYHLKVSTGEIGGLPISVGDVNLSNMTHSRGNETSDILKWAEKFWNNIYKMDNAPHGYGSTGELRSNREYGEDVSSGTESDLRDEL